MFVAGLGLSGVSSAWLLALDGADPYISCDWRVLVISILLFVFTYPLATGRDWARRVLLFAVAVIGTGLVLWRGLKVVAPMSFGHFSPEQIKVVRLWTGLGDLSSFFVALSIVVFGVLFLSHQEVAASFQHRSRADTQV